MISRRLRLLGALSLALVLAAPVVATDAMAQSPQELTCRKALAKGTLRYIRQVMDARQRCVDRIINNKIRPDVDCTTGTGDLRLQKKLPKAEGALARRITRDCTGIQLVLLDFPGSCPVPGDGDFDLEALLACVINRGDEVNSELLSVYYPEIDHFYRGQKENCLERVARRSFEMFLGQLRARQDCLFRGENQKLRPEVDCRAQIPPYGEGTNDPKTDRRLREAYEQVAEIPIACAIADLESLGFQDVCPDPTGPPFTPVDVQSCTFNANRTQMPEYLDTSFPADPVCGNGRLETGEECDDGFGNSDEDADACRTNCLLPICGDNAIDTGEQCDDGNTADGDGCTSACVIEECGDGVVQPGEDCDLGRDNNSDTAPNTCRTDCTDPSCGDGVTDPQFDDEECDDGNVSSNDGCSADCKIEICGDAIVQMPREQCDDGFGSNSNTTPDACRTNCQNPSCGDTVTDPSNLEECDDGNVDQSDGCRNDCTVCGNGVAAGTEECDDGGANSNSTPDACRVDCTDPVCGDGVTDPSNNEECDDGNDNDRDACTNDCKAATCGDGAICDDAACTTGPGGGPEECDDGVGNSDTTADACRENCADPVCGDGVIDVGAGETCDTTADGPCADDELCTDSCNCSHLCPGIGELKLFSGAGPTCTDNGDCEAGTCDPGIGRCRTITRLDSGWKGLAHRGDINDAVVSRAFLECPDAGPTCGECNIAGLDPSTRFCRCSGDLRTVCDKPFAEDAENCSFGSCIDTGTCVEGFCSNLPGRACTVNGNCGSRCSDLPDRRCSDDLPCGPDVCECYFGPPFPLSSSGTPACILNRFFSDVTGTGNVDTGQGQVLADLRTSVFLGILTFVPCPFCGGTCSDDPGVLCAFDEDCTAGTCVLDPTPNDGDRGGTCLFGPAEGLDCDVMAQNTSFPARSGALGGGGYSLDCPPSDGVLVTTGDGLVITVDQSTGRASLPAAIECSPGSGELCHCKQCTKDPNVGCTSNTDCFEQGGECTRVTGAECFSNTDCAGISAGTCKSIGPVKRCEKGLTSGISCETNADCESVDGGTCAVSSCTNSTNPNGVVPQPNSCTDLNCASIGDNNAECVADQDKTVFCDQVLKGNGDGVLPCFTNADCDPANVGIDGGVCQLESKNSCFLSEIVAEGAPDPSFPVGAATFCVPATTNSGINSVAGLPGPGRVRNQAGSKTFCRNDPSVQYTPGVGGCPEEPVE